MCNRQHRGQAYSSSIDYGDCNEINLYPCMIEFIRVNPGQINLMTQNSLEMLILLSSRIVQVFDDFQQKQVFLL